jgi:hypothetical protein
MFSIVALRAQSPPDKFSYVAAESKPHISKMWIASSLFLLAATSLDASSSWGKYEANPFLRSGDGRFGARGFSIKLGITGAMLAPQLLLRKNRTATKIFTFTNFAQAGMYTGIAIHNFGVPEPGQPAK